MIVFVLDAATYTRFTNHILPKKAADVADTDKILKNLFRHCTTVLSRSYTYVRKQRNGEAVIDYTDMVNRRHVK